MATAENTIRTNALPPSGGEVRGADLVLAALLCAAPLAVQWSLTRQLLALITTNDTYSHIPLIPVVSVFLIYMEKDVIFKKVARGWILGGALMAAGAIAMAAARLIVWTAYPYNQISLLSFGFVLVWMGVFALLFGTAAFRAAIFPILFLLFAVPIPEPLVSDSIYFLQHASAETTGFIFRLIGIPVLQNGVDFSLPGVRIRVAEECSGIRSTLALTITSVLAGHLFLRSWWKTSVLAVLLFPIAIFKNALRIVSLSCIAIYWYPDVFASKLHEYGGIPFFVMGLLVLGSILLLLQRIGARPRAGARSAASSSS